MPSDFHDARTQPRRRSDHTPTAPAKPFNPLPIIVAIAAVEGVFLLAVVGAFYFGFITLSVMIPLAIIAAMFATGGIIVLVSQAAAAKRAMLETALRDRGLSTTFKPKKPDKRAAFERLGSPDALGGGATGVRWSASGPVRGRRTEILEHLLVRSGAESSTVVTTTAVACEAPDHWPRVTLARASIGGKLGSLLRGKNQLRVESPEFNDRWRIDLEDDRPETEDFALLLLTPEVQAWLTSTADKLESWSIGRGTVTCMTQKTAEPDTLDALLHRPHDLLARLDPALRDATA